MLKQMPTIDAHKIIFLSFFDSGTQTFLFSWVSTPAPHVSFHIPSNATSDRFSCNQFPLYGGSHGVTTPDSSSVIIMEYVNQAGRNMGFRVWVFVGLLVLMFLAGHSCVAFCGAVPRKL